MIKMSSYCSECGAINEQPHKKTCFWYPQEAKIKDKQIKQLKTDKQTLSVDLKDMQEQVERLQANLVDAKVRNV